MKPDKQVVFLSFGANACREDTREVSHHLNVLLQAVPLG
jgi:hypothetical protein